MTGTGYETEDESQYIDVRMTITLKVKADPDVDLSGLDMGDLETTLSSDVCWNVDGLGFQVAYDHANDPNGYADLETSHLNVTAFHASPAAAAEGGEA